MKIDISKLIDGHEQLLDFFLSRRKNFCQYFTCNYFNFLLHSYMKHIKCKEQNISQVYFMALRLFRDCGLSDCRFPKNGIIPPYHRHIHYAQPLVTPTSKKKNINILGNGKASEGNQKCLCYTNSEDVFLKSR